MKYQGSKSRIVHKLKQFLTPKDGQYYIEPFCGGCNVIAEINTPFRIANDNNYYLIAMWRALIDGWMPPRFVCEDNYNKIKKNPEMYGGHVVGYVGFNSWGTKFFGGYPRSPGRNYWDEYYRNIMAQVPKLHDVLFTYGDYLQMDLPPNSIIYCDPPYKDTLSYANGKINYTTFWNWCRDLTNRGHTVYVSEYTAPDDFRCVWSELVMNALRENYIKEKLWVLS